MEIEQYSFGPYGPFVALTDHEQALAEKDRESESRDLVIEQQAQQITTLREALQGILEIGKRDMTNPKYDGYFEQAQHALKESYSERKKNG